MAAALTDGEPEGAHQPNGLLDSQTSAVIISKRRVIGAPQMELGGRRADNGADANETPAPPERRLLPTRELTQYRWHLGQAEEKWVNSSPAPALHHRCLATRQTPG